MKKVGLISLGCAKNLVDSENILGLLDHHGYQITANPEDADFIVVNTCGFIESSKKESIDTILEMAEYHKKLIVTGCLVERYLDDLKKSIPEIDLLIPIRSYSEFNKYLNQLDNDVDPMGGLSDDYRIVSTGPFSAYLKIGEGCDNRCSYCAIPLIRGGFVSRPYNEIIKEANDLASGGITEVVVLEQDTTKYGIDLKNGENIVSLLKGLLAINKLHYIRLLYLYPDEISDELIELIKDNQDRLTPYFDIPIQHSEDHILKDMFRRGNKEFLTALFSKIRNKIPNAILRTTVMVGFPNETEEDVDNLINFIKKVGFDHLGAFTYSQEEGTPACSFDNQIDEEIKKKRLDKVMRAAQSVSYKLNKKHIGEIMSGIVIGKERDNYLLRSYFNAPDDVDGKIYFKSNIEHKIGDETKVKITESFVYDLIGEEIDEQCNV